MFRWVKALDMLLDKLRVAGLDFTTVFVITHLIFSPLIFFLHMIVIIVLDSQLQHLATLLSQSPSSLSQSCLKFRI